MVAKAVHCGSWSSDTINEDDTTATIALLRGYFFMLQMFANDDVDVRSEQQWHTSSVHGGDVWPWPWPYWACRRQISMLS